MKKVLYIKDKVEFEKKLKEVRNDGTFVDTGFCNYSLEFILYYNEETKITKCPKCNNLNLKHDVEIKGHDEYAVTIHTEFCSCGYGDADVY